jgi:CHAT domain-containing protein
MPRMEIRRPTLALATAAVCLLLSAVAPFESQALRVRAQTADKNEWRTLIKQGDDQSLKGDYPQALASYRRALSLAERITDRQGIAQTLNALGALYYLQGEYTSALEYNQKALTLSEELGERAETAKALLNVGNVHWQRGNLAEALTLYSRSLALYEALDDKAGIARALGSIGIIYRLQGKYGQAIENYQKSLAISEAIGDKILIARTLNNLGTVNNALGNSDLALGYYRKSLAFYEEAGIRARVANTLGNMAVVYRFQGNYRLSLEYAQRSLKISEEISDKQGVALQLSAIASVYSSQGNNEIALDYRLRGLALNQAMGNKREIATNLFDVGLYYLRQAAYEKSLDYYQKSLKIREETGENDAIGESLQSIGLVYERLGKPDLALEYYRRTLAMREANRNGRGLVSTLFSLASFYEKLGQPEQALEFAERSAAAASRSGFQEEFWRGRTIAGRAYQALNRSQEARRAFDDAISTIESLRVQVAGGERDQQLSFERRISPYLEIVKLSVAENRVAEALAYAERAKARVLLDVLRSGRVNVSKAMTASEQERERALRGEVASLNAQISRESLRAQPDQQRLSELRARLQKARLAFEAFQSALYTAHPELKAKRGEAPLITLEQAGELLPDTKTALLEYLVTNEKTYLFVLTRGGRQAKAELRVYPIEVKRTDLETSAENYRRLLARRNTDFSETARTLYRLLLGPAQKQLEGKTKLTVVPDGALWNLPFQALQTDQSRYLIEDHAIAYAPSLTVLREMSVLRRKGHGSPGAPVTLLAFGNPALGKQLIERVKFATRSDELSELPEAEREVKRLAELYSNARSRIYTGAEALEERAKAEAGKYRIIHLATHGVLDDTSPMYSYLVLSQANSSTEDGLLEAWEIMNINLRADLVVLSACETARGRIGAGEGVIGLTWALFVAGAPTTLVSQWKVESASTAQLMLAFHTNYKAELTAQKTKPSEAEALRQAVLKLQQDERYRHPFYWAGFVVVGDGF